MDILNNLGISYKGDYISQGSIVDKCKKSSQLNIKNTEFVIRNDGKDLDFNNLSSIYKGNIIVHLPAININQSNLKYIKDVLLELLKNDIKMITIDASTLLYETYDWSTDEEQQNYLKIMSKGIASIASNGIEVAIENTATEKDAVLFGKTVANISDLLVYSRESLVEQFNYTRDNANKAIGVSINIGNIAKTSEVLNLENWFKVFYNDIKCVKVKDIENTIPMFNNLLDIIIGNKIDVPLLVESSEEIEGIVNAYKKFEYLVKNKLEGKPLNFDNYHNIVNSRYNEYNYNFSTTQSGFTNAVIICMILLTAIIAVLMFVFQVKH